MDWGVDSMEWGMYSILFHGMGMDSMEWGMDSMEWGMYSILFHGMVDGFHGLSRWIPHLFHGIGDGLHTF